MSGGAASSGDPEISGVPPPARPVLIPLAIPPGCAAAPTYWRRQAEHTGSCRTDNAQSEKLSCAAPFSAGYAHVGGQARGRRFVDPRGYGGVSAPCAFNGRKGDEQS